MIFTETDIPGCFHIDIEPSFDERGFFARTFCKKEFAARGLETEFVQCSISYNKKKGTLRGMHYQVAPHEEVKIVSCLRGAIYDVALDLRRDRESFGKWIGVELTGENRRSLYIPKGCAHGFFTVTDDATVYYRISEFYHSESSKGIRCDDPAFGICWPFAPAVISAKDAMHPMKQIK